MPWQLVADAFVPQSPTTLGDGIANNTWAADFDFLPPSVPARPAARLTLLRRISRPTDLRLLQAAAVGPGRVLAKNGCLPKKRNGQTFDLWP